MDSNGAINASAYDVVVVGGSIGGLISAALLAKRGYKVALVEHLDQPGGGMGATEHNGYWINLGHRDSHGMGDLSWICHHGMIAAKEIGIDGQLTSGGNDMTSVISYMHALPEGKITTLDNTSAWQSQSDGGMEHYLRLMAYYGFPADADVARRVQEAMGAIAAIPDKDVPELITVTVQEWLVANVPDQQARLVILQVLENACACPAEHTSLGRFVLHCKGALHYHDAMALSPLDPQVGGMQSCVTPWVEAFKAHGGELWLGWKPVEITVREKQVTGVIALDKSSLVKVFEAPVVITDFDCWDLPSLVDRNLLPRDYVRMAEEARSYVVPSAWWYAGLNRLPRRRSDGKVEDFLGHQRIIYGLGRVKNYHGGWKYPSSYSPRDAPEGKHLMTVSMPNFGETVWRSFADAKHSLDINIDYVKKYYLDLEECIDWSGYQYKPRQSHMFYLRPIRLPPVKVATLDGLYVAAASVEGTSAWVDREAEAALTAVALAEAEYGEFLKRRRARS